MSGAHPDLDRGRRLLKEHGVDDAPTDDVLDDAIAVLLRSKDEGRARSPGQRPIEGPHETPRLKGRSRDES
jgi:hypothetical protein